MDLLHRKPILSISLQHAPSFGYLQKLPLCLMFKSYLKIPNFSEIFGRIISKTGDEETFMKFWQRQNTQNILPQANTMIKSFYLLS